MIEPSCRHCRSTRLVGHGTSSVSAPTVHDNGIVEASFEVMRFNCRDCGRTSTVRDPALSLAEAEVRDHLVRLVFANGQAAASRITGCPRGTLQRHLKAWAEAREADVLEAEPGFILIETVCVRGEDRTLVIDLDRETIVELLSSTKELRTWAAVPGRAPAFRVCIPFDAGIRTIVSECLPRAEILIAPVIARRRLLVEGMLAYRTLRRQPEMQGKNGLPLAHEFAASLAGKNTDMTSWPVQVMALSGSVRAALGIAMARDLSEARSRLAEFEIASSGSESRRISSIIRTWMPAIMAGITHRYVDRAASLASKVRRDLSSRRPALGFSDLRAFAVLDGFERRAEMPFSSNGRPPMAVSRGRPLQGLLAVLSAA